MHPSMLEIVVLETARELLIVDHFLIGLYLSFYFDFNKLKQFTFLSFFRLSAATYSAKTQLHNVRYPVHR